MAGKKLSIIIALFLAIALTANTESQFDNFVTASGNKLMDGDTVLRFVSFNIPCLHYGEDNMPFEQTNAWRLPNAFETNDALEAIRQMGGKVTRCYTLSVRKPGESDSIPRHVLAPGEFNEEAFKALDKVLQVANEKGIRVIIPFVDNWVWWGGIKEYATFRGKEKEAFWTAPEIIADFKKTVEFVINRTNTYTGTKYKDDKAIFAWETGNELQSPQAWVHEIATYIKSLDKNHLVIDGHHTSILKEESITDPADDIVTTHHYPNKPEQLYDQLKQSIEKLNGRKPYFVGEFGFLETAPIEKFLDMLIESDVSGALIWSLRYRNQDGGFYWHSEPFGGNRYKAYHWPGFDSGADYDEKNLLATMRKKAFEINDLDVPPILPPVAPTLLPIEDAAAISWQGSTGASTYDIQRATSYDGPFAIIATAISDAAIQYAPLFADTTAKHGTYYYRIIANNSAGKSRPSNIAGPVKVTHRTVYDQMKDYSQIHAHTGNLSFATKDTRKSKEDIHRIKGQKDATLTYLVDAQIDSATVYAFFPKDVTDFTFSVSADSQSFTEIPSTKTNYAAGKNAYGYWKPIKFQIPNSIKNAKFLKIKYNTDAQISRVEIRYGKTQTPDLKAMKKSAQKNLQENILPFWLKYSIDEENGGFHGRIATDGTPEQNAPKGLVLNARILWTFSAAYMYDSKPAYLKTARRAYEYFIENFIDPEHDGAYWMLDCQGKATDDSKELYGQSFAVYALTEYYRDTGHYPAIEKAIALYNTIEAKAHDKKNKGHMETFSRDWIPAANARLAYGQENATKTMNTHLHLLEAYTNLYRVWQDPKLKASLHELIIVFRDHIIDHETWHFKLFFDSQWNSTSETISFGHDIEGSWLLTEAAELLGNEELLEEIEKISIKMAQACYDEALDTDGGLFYEAEPHGISIKRKDWWPQAETVVGFLNAYQLTNQPHYLTAANNCWKFTLQNLVDDKYGEWFSKASAERPGDKAQKTSEWKAPYHNGRACLEIIHRTGTLKNTE